MVDRRIPKVKDLAPLMHFKSPELNAKKRRLAAALTIKTAPNGVYVMNRMRLAKWLQTFPDLLDDASIERIYDAARRSTTWRPRS